MAFENVFSFDIETTGKHREARYGPVSGPFEQAMYAGETWSMGGASTSGKKYEHFVKIEDVYKKMEALRASSDFHKHSMDFGALKHYLDNIKMGGVSLSETDALQRITSDIKDSINNRGMILFQNLNFEARWLVQTKENQLRIGDSFFKDLMYTTNVATDKRNADRWIYEPPAVTESMRYARKTRDEIYMRALGREDKLLNAEELNDISNAYKQVMKVYEALDDYSKVAKHGLYTADLMHFTAATFSQAAAQGHLDQIYISRGHSVDLLAQVFLGEKEFHSSAGDAEQQLKIFQRLKEIRNGLDGGALSEADKLAFQKLNRIAPLINKQVGLKGMIGFLEDARDGIFNSSMKVGTKTITVFDRNMGRDIPLTIDELFYSKDPKKAIRNFVANTDFLNRGDSNLKALSIKLMELYNSKVNPSDNQLFGRIKAVLEEAKTQLEETGAAIDDLIVGKRHTAKEGSKILNDIEAANRRLERETASILSPEGLARETKGLFSAAYEFADELYQRNIVQSENAILKLMPRKTGSGLALIGAVGILGLMANTSGSKRREEEIRMREMKKRNSLYTDQTFTMMNQDRDEYPIMPAGVGMANWMNRNKHYEY